MASIGAGARSDDVLVVVPTYNEALNVPRLVAGLEPVREHLPLHVLFVDDGSPDRTADVVSGLASTRPWVHLMVRDAPRGLGSAYREGFRWGLTFGFQRLGEMDADLSHDPADVPRLAAELDRGADLAIGSRYVPGGRTVGWPLRRQLLSRCANAFARGVLRLSIRDVTAGFRLYRAAAVERVLDIGNAQCNGYGFQVEAAYAVAAAGLRITEVPITFRERELGISKLSSDSAVEAARRCLSLALWHPSSIREREGVVMSAAVE